MENDIKAITLNDVVIGFIQEKEKGYKVYTLVEASTLPDNYDSSESAIQAIKDSYLIPI